MTDIYFVDEEEQSRNAAKAGLMLAKARYNAKYANFVRKSASRLAYIEDELTVIARECAEQVDADPARVEAYLRAAIAEELAVTEAERADVVNDGPARGELHAPNVDHVEPAEDQHDLDIKDPDGVATEIENQDHRSDLNEDTGKFGGIVRAYAASEIGNAGDESTWKRCYRCSRALNPVVASVSPVCPTCTILITTAEKVTFDPSPEEDTPLAPADGSLPVDQAAAQRGTKALEIVSLDNGQVVEEIPLIRSDPDYVAQVTLGLYTQMDRDKFFIREVEVPAPQGLDIGEDQEEFEVNPLVEPVPPMKTPTPERAPEPEREPVKTHQRDAAQVLDPNTQSRCEMCSFTGTLPQVQLHESQTHPELAQRAQQQQTLNATPGIAPAALPGVTPAYGSTGLPRPGSAFKLVARFTNLQDLHEWEQNAGRGN